MGRLTLIGAQDALILLRASFSAPTVQHLLRCCPSAGVGPVVRGSTCDLSEVPVVFISYHSWLGGLGAWLEFRVRVSIGLGLGSVLGLWSGLGLGFRVMVMV